MGGNISMLSLRGVKLKSLSAGVARQAISLLIIGLLQQKDASQ